MSPPAWTALLAQAAPWAGALLGLVLIFLGDAGARRRAPGGGTVKVLGALVLGASVGALVSGL